MRLIDSGPRSSLEMMIIAMRRWHNGECRGRCVAPVVPGVTWLVYVVTDDRITPIH